MCLFEFAHLASYNHVGTHPFILQLLELASRDLGTRPRVSVEDGLTELPLGLDSVPWPGAPPHLLPHNHPLRDVEGAGKGCRVLLAGSAPHGTAVHLKHTVVAARRARSSICAVCQDDFRPRPRRDEMV